MGVIRTNQVCQLYSWLNATNPAAVLGRWIHVSINLTRSARKFPVSHAFSSEPDRPDSHPHYHLANVLIQGYTNTEDHTQAGQAHLTYDALTLAVQDQQGDALYKIDYGTSTAYGSTFTGMAPSDWSRQHSRDPARPVPRPYLLLPGLRPGGRSLPPRVGVKAGSYKIARRADPSRRSSPASRARLAKSPAGQSAHLDFPGGQLATTR
jgi:hypothetical protein